MGTGEESRHQGAHKPKLNPRSLSPDPPAFSVCVLTSPTASLKRLRPPSAEPQGCEPKPLLPQENAQVPDPDRGGGPTGTGQDGPAPLRAPPKPSLITHTWGTSASY